MSFEAIFTGHILWRLCRSKRLMLMHHRRPMYRRWWRILYGRWGLVLFRAQMPHATPSLRQNRCYSPPQPMSAPFQKSFIAIYRWWWLLRMPSRHFDFSSFHYAEGHSYSKFYRGGEQGYQKQKAGSAITAIFPTSIAQNAASAKSNYGRLSTISKTPLCLITRVIYASNIGTPRLTGLERWHTPRVMSYHYLALGTGEPGAEWANSLMTAGGISRFRLIRSYRTLPALGSRPRAALHIRTI